MSIGSVSGSIPDFSGLRAHRVEKFTGKFETFDADGSGGLSLEEFTEFHANRLERFSEAPRELRDAETIFSHFDADDNGEVTLEEFRSGNPHPRSGRYTTQAFSILLSAQEQSGSSLLQGHFDSFDTDSSGGLSLGEFTELSANRPGKSGESNGRAGLEHLQNSGEPRVGPPPGPPPGLGARGLDAETIFSVLDTDGDGEVTLAELPEAGPLLQFGNVASKTFSTLLSAQEESGLSSLLELHGSETQNGHGEMIDLLKQLLDELRSFSQEQDESST